MTADGFTTFLHSEVPDFLRDSQFYMSLEDDENEPISLPSDCARFSLQLNPDEFKDDLRILLNTFRFWGVNRLLHITEFTTFIVTSRIKTLCRNVLSEFEAELAELRVLIQILDAKTKEEALCAAISCGEFELVKIMAANKYPFSQSCVVAAAQHNRVDCLEFALSKGCYWETRLMNIAARQGHVEILKFAEKRSLKRGIEVCAGAAKGGHLACLQYAYENGHRWKEKVCPMHNLPIVLYARSIGAVWPERTCCEAAERGSLDVLQYLHEGNDYPYPISSKALLAAVWMGHTDCVRYLRSIDIPWIGFECELAAYRGHLDTLKYLCESGCEYNMLTSWMCTIYDQMECLQYLHERGCLWDCTTQTNCKDNCTYSSTACRSCSKSSIIYHCKAPTTCLQVVYLFERKRLLWCLEDPDFMCIRQVEQDFVKAYEALDQSCPFGIAALCTYYNAPRCLQYAYGHRCAWPDDPFLLPNSSFKAIQRCIHALCRPSSSPISTTNLRELCRPTNKHTFLSALTSGALLKSPADDSTISSNNIREAISKSGQKCSTVTSAKCNRETREKKLSKWSTIGQLGTVVQRDMYSYRVRDSLLMLGAMVVVSTVNFWLCTK